MKSFQTHLILASLFFSVFGFAQQAREQYLQEQLSEQKEQIQWEARQRLKSKIKEVNETLLTQEISEAKADSLKLKYAEETALEIEQELLELETAYYQDTTFDKQESESQDTTPITYYTRRNRERRNFVSNDLVFAAGLNNLLEENTDLEDTSYEFVKSFFVELGWSWKTNLIPNTGFVNLRYGFSFQFNSLRPKDKGIFAPVQGTIERIPYDQPLIRNQLQYTNFVIPIHLELGSNRKQFTQYTSEGNTVKRSYNRNSIILGAGGYGGFNIHNIQRIKGVDFKEKIKNDLNFNDLVYGVSGYVSFPRVLTLYAKADLSPLFKNQPYLQNNISLGVRFDID